ncbi:hypothetical protein ZWY2020_059503 [Hordeum vulgare]|nr:hypothetical protein ZWY2020_059503 [Hordeum vulgare]
MEAARKTIVGAFLLILLMASSSQVSCTENNCYKEISDNCPGSQNKDCRDTCIEMGWDDGQCRNRAQEKAMFRFLTHAKCECYPPTCDH